MSDVIEIHKVANLHVLLFLMKMIFCNHSSKVI